MTFMPSLDKPWFLLYLAWFLLITCSFTLYYKIMWNLKFEYSWFNLIKCIFALSCCDTVESWFDTSITRIPTYACAPRWKPRPGGASGGAGAPMVRPHHPWLRWLPIFLCIFLILEISQPWRCLVCFHHGRGPRSCISYPIACPILTPSYKLSSLPPLSTQALSSAMASHALTL
jgi:hypothetical protein